MLLERFKKTIRDLNWMRHHCLVSAAGDNILGENKNCKNVEVVLGGTSEEVI